MHPVLVEDLERVLSADLPWYELDGKTVLISGANGFLPAYMVRTLLFRNEGLEPAARTTVLALVRNQAKAEQRFSEYAGRDDLKFVVQDVSEPITISGPVDAIVHAASQASPKFYGIDPVGTLLANVQGTRNLLDLAREKRSTNFLYFSSGEVYGQVDNDHVPTAEDDYCYLDPTNVRACYGESKRMGENMCVCWNHQYGVPATIARPFHTYGPGMALDDGRSFADFVADIVANRDIVLKSAGTATRAFCYLSDATEGFFTVLLKGVAGQAYNVGNDLAEISISDLAEALVSLFPERGLRVVRENVHDASTAGTYLQSPISRGCPDIAKVRALGWNPTTDILSGFGRTVRSFE